MAWILTALIMVGAAALRLPLLDVPLDRDEGEYAYVARLLLDGIPPFADAHNMKMPGIYAVYSVLLTVFGSTHTAIHLGLLFANALSIALVFLLGRRLMDATAGVAAAATYALLTLSETVLGSAANAEHFVVPLALSALVLLDSARERSHLTRLLLAGLLLGLAARCLLSRLRAARGRAGAPLASSRGAARRGDDAGRGARRRDGRARPSPHVLVLDRAVRVRVCIGAPAVRRRARPHEPPRGTARAHVATLGPRRRRWRRAVRGRASAPVARLPAAVRADVRPGHRCRLLLPAALLRAGRACNRAPRRRRGERDRGPRRHHRLADGRPRGDGSDHRAGRDLHALGRAHLSLRAHADDGRATALWG